MSGGRAAGNSGQHTVLPDPATGQSGGRERPDRPAASAIDPGVEARVAEDSWHVGTYGLIWFAHPYSVEYSSGLWRGVCRCGWRGDWFLWQIGAELDAEAHPAHAAYPAERAS